MKRISFLGLILIASSFLFNSCSTDSDNSDGGNDNNNPTAFNLLFVNDNATDIILTPILNWEAASDPDGDTVSYQLLIDKISDLDGDEDPSTVVQSNINVNTFILNTALMAGTAYKWCVIATDGNGGSTKSSSVFSFTTAINGTQTNLPPNMFVLQTPSNGATNVSLDPQLTWQVATDPDNDPVFYDVFFGEGLNPNTQISFGNLITNTFVNQLDENTMYSWYVLAKDIAGNVRSSSTFSFTTGSNNQGPISLLNSEVKPNYEGYAGHQMVNYNNKLWSIGGRVISPTVNGETNEVWSSSNNGVDWDLVKANDPSDLNSFVPSDEHQAVVFRDEIWVMEGNRNTVKKSTDGINWTTVPFSGTVAGETHYTPRHQHQCVVFNNRLWIIGGSSRNDVWSTDGVLNVDNEVTWIRNKPNDNNGFSARNGHQAVVIDNKMWVIGGTTGNTRLNDVWSSTDGETWVQELFSAPFTERTEHTCVVSGDILAVLWLIGGDGINPNNGVSVTSLNDIWYSFDGLNWVQYDEHIDDDLDENVFTGRKEAEAVVNDLGEIIVDGGKRNATFLNDLWHFQF